MIKCASDGRQAAGKQMQRKWGSTPRQDLRYGFNRNQLVSTEPRLPRRYNPAKQYSAGYFVLLTLRVTYNLQKIDNSLMWLVSFARNNKLLQPSPPQFWKNGRLPRRLVLRP
jgi:hypothetical protein